jgi:hypothetical protein
MDLKEMIAKKLPGHATTQISGGNGYYLKISWFAHIMAWRNYEMLFPGQSAQRINERGGFGEEELNAFYPEWRNHIIKDQSTNQQ